MQYENFNDKYYSLKQDSNPNSLFASFNVFKTYVRGKVRGSRPPYPIINSNPTIGEVFYNVNRSDALLAFTFVLGGFGVTIMSTRNFTTLTQKFLVTKYMMYWWSLCGFFLAMNCSYYRQKGWLDNGLRWRQKDLLYSKYDITSEFERNTIFKHFRLRID